MILHAEQRQRFVAHAFVGVIVQIDVGDFDFARGQRFRVHAETVILGSDFDLFGEQVFHRMIRTVMAELQLESFSAEGEATQLVAEANAEDRNLADELSNVFHGVADGLGIAGTVRKKDSVGLHLQNVFGGGLRGDDVDFALVIHEQTQEYFA